MEMSPFSEKVRSVLLAPQAKVAKIIASSICILFVAGTAHASLIISKTNSTPGAVDGSSATRSVTINAGDLLGSPDSVLDVNLIVDFSKCSAGADTTGCTGGSGFTFNREIVFTLSYSATTVNIVNQDTFSGQSGNTRVTQTYDDEALSLVGGSTLLTGSFQPVGNLSDFDGLTATGVWTFFFQDTVGLDPLVVHDFTLQVTVPGSIPEPTTLLLMGIGLAGLGFARRRKLNA